MRLMASDLTLCGHFRKENQISDYVGTETVEKEMPEFKAQVYPVSDSYSVELYGERVHSIMRMNCDNSVDIRGGDKIIVSEKEYKVISVTRYRSHQTAEIERNG